MEEVDVLRWIYVQNLDYKESEEAILKTLQNDMHLNWEEFKNDRTSLELFGGKENISWVKMRKESEERYKLTRQPGYFIGCLNPSTDMEGSWGSLVGQWGPEGADGRCSAYKGSVRRSQRASKESHYQAPALTCIPCGQHNKHQK